MHLFFLMFKNNFMMVPDILESSYQEKFTKKFYINPIHIIFFFFFFL